MKVADLKKKMKAVAKTLESARAQAQKIETELLKDTTGIPDCDVDMVCYSVGDIEAAQSSVEQLI